MNISLRRAAALQNAIQECLRGIALDVNLRLNEFQESETVIAQCQEKLSKNFSQRQGLIDTLYQIRAQVGDANQTAGINQRLTNIACIERLMQDHQTLANAAVRLPSAVIAGQLNKIREARPEHRGYGYDGTVETTALREQDIQAHRRRLQELRRERQLLQDEILELNVRTEISLSPAALEILKEHDLI